MAKGSDVEETTLTDPTDVSIELMTQCDKLIGVPATLAETTLWNDLVLETVSKIANSDMSGFRLRQLWSNHS